MDKFAKRLKELRIQKQLSILDLSKTVGIGTASLRRWETNQSDIKRSRHLIILAKFFNVSADYLLGLKD